MRTSMLTVLGLLLLGGVASADPREHRRDDHHNNGRADRDHRGDHSRGNRHVITRRAVYANDGRFVFVGGTSHAYARPVIRARYYNARVRPMLVTENYGYEPGYIWVRGQWTWGGSEWRWGDGHYVPDPQYSTYYDDGSYDYAVRVQVGR